MNQGALLAILASLIFSVMNVLVKTIADEIPTGEIVFFRSSIGCLLIGLLMYQRGIAFIREDRPLLVLRGTMGALYLICYFYSIAHLTLADASMLAYLSPFFSIVLSLLVLRERVNATMAFWLVMVIIGAIILIRPWNFSTYTLASLVGVMSAVFAAIAYLSVNKLTKRHHNYEIVFYFLFIATLISIPLMWHNFVLAEWVSVRHSHRHCSCLIARSGGFNAGFLFGQPDRGVGGALYRHCLQYYLGLAILG